MELSGRFMEIWDIAKDYLKRGREQDLQHTRVCVDFAFRLLREEGGDKEIVIPAIILHDIGYSVIKEDNLYLKSTYYSIYKKRKERDSYSSELKKRHMIEGARIAEDRYTAIYSL